MNQMSMQGKSGVGSKMQSKTYLDSKAAIQESAYSLPYHFFVAPPEGLGSIGDALHYTGSVEVATGLIEPIEGFSVLDAGCGDGRVAYELVRRGGQVLGIDTSDRAISLARVLVPKASFLVGTITEIRGCDNDFFDRSLALEVLEHLGEEEREQAVRELYRVLKPEGILIVSVPSIRVPLLDKHYVHFSEMTLKNLLSKYFIVEAVVGLHRKNFWYSVMVRLFDNQWVSSRWIVETVYRHFIRTCKPDQGVQLLARCIKPTNSENRQEMIKTIG